MPGGEFGSGDGKMPVTFAVEIPAATPVLTRASYGDCDVINMDVLVFDQDGKFLERIETDRVSGDGSVKSFTIRIDPSPAGRSFIVIANARTAEGDDRVDMTGLTPGMSETSVAAMLTTLPLAGGRADEILPLIMSGTGTLPRVDDANGSLSVKLRRAAACIQVRVGQPDDDNGLEDFSLLRASLADVSAKAFVVSASDETVPNVADSLLQVNYCSSAEEDDAGWSVGAQPLLYTYERRNDVVAYGETKAYGSIIVQASWKGREYYYRIWLHDGEGHALDFLRNHRYIVTITGVNGPGYRTLEEAVNYRAGNGGGTDLDHDVTLNSMENYDICQYVVSGIFVLGLNNTSFEGWGSSYNGRWELVGVTSTYVDAFSMLSCEITPADLLSDPRFEYRQGGLGLMFTNTNASAADRSGSVTVRCGTLALPVAVRFVESKFQNGYVDKDGDSYVFLLADETTPRPWKVWFPRLETGEVNGLKLLESSSAADYSPAAGEIPLQRGHETLDSRAAGKAYLHVPTSAVYDCTGKWFYLSDGTGEVRRIMIMNY